jgi:hypothetical protein
MDQISTIFPESYMTSRARFRSNIKQILNRWSTAQLSQKQIPVEDEDDLTVDWISATALDRQQKLFILTTGEHGVEGYVGSAMQELFIQEFFPQLNPQDTGLLLVHAINPWGMKHKRRVNSHNVDLNRNFVLSPSELDNSFNPGYRDLNDFLNPSRPHKSGLGRSLSFYLHLLVKLASHGLRSLRSSTLLGQYSFTKGLYFGGTCYQIETQTMIDLYHQHFSLYDQILHFDMHTGYGPRYQMSLVNSIYDPRDSADYVERFQYPLIVKTNPKEFYAMRGDMVDYEYCVMAEKFPDKKFFATAFEFGTFGDSIWSALRSMRTMIYENQLFWHGSSLQRLDKRINQDFLELYYPSELRWRQKAISDTRQAFQGILHDQGYLISDR